MRIGSLAVGAALAMSAIAVAPTSAMKLPAPARLTPNQPALPPLGQSAPMTSGASPLRYSYNWSGYVAGSGSEAFRTVSSTYVQPAVTCSDTGEYTLFWVGLDGWFSNTVEQAGTAVYCAGSTPVYFAWWEIYPTDDIVATVAVSPGDTIHASVKYSSGLFTFTVMDQTDGTLSTTVQKCASGLTCARSSGEWIIERPGFESQSGFEFLPLANWGIVALAKDKAAARARTGSIAAFPHFAIDMVDEADTYELATAGALDGRGSSFLDTWDAAD